MQRKMEGLEWSEKARQYHATIEECVVHFRGKSGSGRHPSCHGTGYNYAAAKWFHSNCV